jgi:hypothetical protein
MVGIRRLVGYHDELRHSGEEMDRIDFSLFGHWLNDGHDFFLFVFPAARFGMNPLIIW